MPPATYLRYFERMAQHDIQADTNTFTQLIRACVVGGALEEALEIFEWMVSGRDVQEAIPADIHTYNSLIRACHQAGRLEKALEIMSWLQVCFGGGGEGRGGGHELVAGVLGKVGGGGKGLAAGGGGRERGGGRHELAAGVLWRGGGGGKGLAAGRDELVSRWCGVWWWWYVVGGGGA